MGILAVKNIEDRLKASASLDQLTAAIERAAWNWRQANAVADILRHTVTHSTDLRTIELPEKTHGGLRQAFFEATTFAVRWIELHHFARPEDLGPLADVLVYGTDLHGLTAGYGYGYGGLGLKSHNPIDCPRRRRYEPECMHVPTELQAGADCLTLATFLYRTPDFRGCSFCGGAVIQRLTDEQYAYYSQLRETSTTPPCADLGMPGEIIQTLNESLRGKRS
ncbi:hypothetical protein [Streptomyces sp. NPDC002851]